jgi:hypothetical protein
MRGRSRNVAKELRPALAHLRTSSAANTGADKDSGKRQRAAIDAFARSAGLPASSSRAQSSGRCRPGLAV